MPARPKSLIQPDDILRLVTVSDPQISPDGEQIAFTHKSIGAKQAREAAVWIVGAGAGRARRLTEGPRDGSARWSPDGGSLLFVRAKEKGAPQLAMISVGSASLPKVTLLTNLPDGSMSDIEWSPDGTRVAFRWRATLEQFSSAAVKSRKESGASTPPLVIDDPWYRLDGDGYFGSARYRLFVLDLVSRGSGSKRRGGRSVQAARATRKPREVFACEHLDDFSFHWAPDGRSIAVACNRDPRALFHPERAEIVLVDPDGRIPARAISGLPSGPKDTPRWSPDGTRIAWAGRRGRSSMYDTANVELWCAEVNAHAARPRATSMRSLTASSDYCLMVGTLSDTADAAFSPWYRWAPDSGSLLMRIGWHGAGRIASVDASGGKVHLHTGHDADLMPASVSAHGHRVACIRSAPTLPPEVVIAEVDGYDFSVVARTDLNSAFVRDRTIASVTEHWIAPTGRELKAPAASPRGNRSSTTAHAVHTWVMRPPRGAPSRKGAAVLEIHGGPHAQYGAAFFHEFQMLAAAGYTVVYSNPRGSKGYGARFCGAIKGAWGTADWKDIQAVTNFMKRIPGVRAERLGIMGGSYGGYMTNWAIAHTHGYRAAITDRCVSDLASMCGSSDYPEVPDLYWPGVSWDRPKALWRSSPIAHFKGVRTPTLIIHSEGDLRCNIEQSEQVHASLVAQGVPCRFVRYPRETSHGMSRVGPADLRIHRLHQILDWWATHLG